MNTQQPIPDGDGALVLRVQGGDNSAFDLLMERHQETVARQMQRYARSPDEAEELTQTVFVNAYLGLGKFSRRAPFIHWLKSIASRVGYEHWRKEYRRKKTAAVAVNNGMTGDESGLDAIIRAESGKRLEELMLVLKPADRQALYLVHVDNLTIAEAASVMGWNHAVTKMREYRARMKLRKLLRAEEGK